MKTKIIIALVAVAALCSIAYFIITKTGLSNPPIPRDSKFNIVGEWKLDTAYNNKDSASLSLLALAFVDSSVVFKFNADSTLQTISPNEVTKQNYYVSKDSLFVKQDSAYTVSVIQVKTDSLISMINKDSTVFVMSRKAAK
jgi:hypothetical protein